MEEITLTLTLNEVNKVIESLSFMPFKDVAGLINKVTFQGNTQLEENKNKEPKMEVVK